MKVWYLVLALALLAPSPSPSGGPFSSELKLEVAGDGATGVTVRVLDADGRPPAVDVRLVLTATAVEGGRTVGPLQLNPASEGRGFYASGPVLSPGRWTVVVSSTVSSAVPVRAEVVVEARTAQSPPPTSAAATPDTSDSSDSAWWPWLVGALVVAAGFTAVALVRLRRRS